MGNTRKPRPGWIEDGVGYIPLTKGQVAKVDPEDVGRLGQRRWYTSKATSTGCFYATRMEMDSDTKKNLMFHMHREILCLSREDKEHGDHINHDTLDNRKVNLRKTTPNQNHWNTQRRNRKSSTGFKGVALSKKNGKYQATLKVNGQQIWLGYHPTAELAYEAYLAASHKYHGEFACLN